MGTDTNIIELDDKAVICEKGKVIERLYFICEGNVCAYSTYAKITLGPGAIIGLPDAYYSVSLFTYVVDKSAKLEAYDYKSMNDIATICHNHTDSIGKMAILHNKYALEMIKIYLPLFMKTKKAMPDFLLDVNIHKWELDKFNALSTTPADLANHFYTSPDVNGISAITEASRFISKLNDACTQMASILGIDLSYVIKETAPEDDIILDDSAAFEQNENSGSIEDELKNSAMQIFKYAGYQDDDIKVHLALINEFVETSDKLSSDDNVRSLRRKLTSLFYELYYYVFTHAYIDEDIPEVISMFMNFGYLDENLLGIENSVVLYKLNRHAEYMCFNDDNVFTMFRWLSRIYSGKKEPSKNNFDLSYDEYIKEEIKSGNFKGTLEAAQKDIKKKVKFEIENLFTSGHRMTYGKVSSFVPFMIKENVYKPLATMLVSADSIMKEINELRALDYSVFYRSTIFSDSLSGISKEYVYSETIPDIILMPTIGSLGALWQEIEGRSRTSRARTMFPILCNGSLKSLVINVAGKFRWEMCKRIQGTYWNDITEKSLTSEYCDYIQFFKKNKDISDVNKEKIKSALLSCHNNFSEMFAREYEQWIVYESAGTAKLNKVSRLIFSKYCPFNAQVREELKSNPQFIDAIEAGERIKAAPKRRLTNMITSLEAKGIHVPAEIRSTLSYWSL